MAQDVKRSAVEIVQHIRPVPKAVCLFLEAWWHTADSLSVGERDRNESLCLTASAQLRQSVLLVIVQQNVLHQSSGQFSVGQVSMIPCVVILLGTDNTEKHSNGSFCWGHGPSLR